MAAPITLNANINLNPASVTASARQVQQALGRITGQASEFQKSLDASTARVFAFGATTAIIQGVTQSFKRLVTTTIEVQAKLIEINSILGASASEFGKFREAIFQAAKNTGQAFNTVANGAAELARQGLSAAETAKRLEAAMILTRISGMGAEASVKALTAAMNGFTSAGLSAEDIVNKIVAVDTRFAVSAQDLADGFSRAGSTAEDAGVSFDELLGLITAVEQKTARGGAVIGNAFKSIFTRLSRGSTIDDLRALGVEIDASQTGVQKLMALSKAIESISDPTQANAIKELAGGVYQINVVSSTLKDLASDTSIFAAATKAAGNAGQDAYSRNAELNKSMLAQINSLVLSVTSFAEKIGTITFGPLLENLVGIATSLSEWLDKALDPEKGNKFVQGLFATIGKFISGPGLVIITTAFLNIVRLVTKFAAEGFKTVMQIGGASEKVKNIEGGIVQLLAQDARLRAILASTTATQAQKEAAVIAAIRQQNALLTQQQQLVTNIARVAAQGGVTGYGGPTQGFGGKKGRRFASGYNPYAAEESEAMSLGASSSVKAYKTNLKGLGPAIVNTEEDIVNIGGKDAVIPRYASSPFRYSGPVSAAKRGSAFSSLSAEEFQSKFGILEYNTRKRAAQNPAKGSAAQRQIKVDSLRRERQNRPASFNFNNDYGMIVPEKGGPSSAIVYVSKTEKGISATETPTDNTVGKVKVPIYRLNEQAALSKEMPTLINEFTNLFAKEALSAAHDISGGVLPSPARQEQIKKTLNKGSATSAAGSVFESAIAAMLQDNDFADFSNRATGSLMDFTGSSLTQLKGGMNPFNIPNGTKGLEAKYTSGLAGGAAEKIYKILGPDQKKAFQYRNVPRKARGHIPRFAKGNASRPQGFNRKGMPLPSLSIAQSTTSATQTNSSTKGIDAFGGKALALSVALTGATQAVDMFAASAAKNGNETLAMAASVGATITQFASMGSLFGPFGIAIGAAVGGLVSFKNFLDKVSDEQAQAQAEIAGNRRSSAFNKTTGEALRSKNFGSVSELRDVSSYVSKKMGVEDYSKEIDSLRAIQRDWRSTTEQQSTALNRLTEIADIVANYSDNAEEFDKLTASIVSVEGSMNYLKMQIDQASENFSKTLSSAKFVTEARSTILGSISGPAAQSLVAQNTTNADINTAAESFKALNEAKTALAINQDPEKTTELTDNLKTASEEFKNNVISAAANMQSRMIEVANRQKIISQEIESRRMSMLNDAIGRLTGGFTEGPVDIDIIKRLGATINAGGNPERTAQAAAELEMELSKAPAALRDAFLKLANINQSKLDQAYLQTGVKGGTASERGAISGAMDKENKDSLSALTVEQQALTIETQGLTEKFKKFKDGFNVDNIVADIENMSKGLKDAGANLQTFASASTSLTETANSVIQATDRLKIVVEVNNARITELEKQLGILKSDRAKLTQ